jgi:acyl-CoA synthetase (AMP-forming)/AMP-acid ligase II
VIQDWIDRAAARHADAAYLEDARGSGELTYADLARHAATWAGYLEDAGVAPGASVAIRLPDPLQYAAALIGIAAAGRVAVPIDPAAPASETARVLAVAKPSAVACDPAEGLEKLYAPDQAVSAIPAAGPGRGHGAASPRGTGGIYLCTSGTTGTPKGILLSEEQLCHVAAGVAAHHRLSTADRGYCCLPLFHINAEVVGLLATLNAGACLVLDRKFSRSRFWPVIAERRITWINAVPAIITVLGLDPAGLRPPEGIRFIRSASAPLPASALRRFEDAFGIPVLETYGMTEAASMITANPLDGPRKAGSAGLPVGVELRVVSSAGEWLAPCGPDVVGRVQIRGPGVITRYASGGRAGAIDPEGWLDTGDLGHLDADGYLFLAGRSDDVINRGGEKIYPREIEEFLLTQHGVMAAVVVSAPDEVLGECPVAYVVPSGTRRGAEMSQALRDACDTALPRHKRPAAIRFVEQLPTGPTGKVVRHRLRELSHLG